MRFFSSSLGRAPPATRPASVHIRFQIDQQLQTMHVKIASGVRACGGRTRHRRYWNESGKGGAPKVPRTCGSRSAYWSRADPFEPERTPPVRLPALLRHAL